MTTLGVLGDLHGRGPGFDSAIDVLADERVDGVLLVGDFASRRWERESRGTAAERADLEREIATVVAELQERLGVRALWVPGNHDLRDVDGPGAVDRRLELLSGVRVFGIGGAGPARFGFPYEWSDAEIAALPVPECEVLLSHAPPRGTLDRTISGARVGSRAVQGHAHRAVVVVCGHIHEAGGVGRSGEALCLNAGSFGEPFAQPQVGFVRFGAREVTIEHRVLDDERRAVLSQPLARPAAVGG